MADAGAVARLDVLEARQLLTTIFAISDDNTLLEFDSATPQTIARATPITGLGGGEFMATIAFNPVTEELYGIPSGSRTPVYTINRTTGAATRIGPGVPFGFPLDKATGLAFDELHGYFRYIDETFGNYRIDPLTGFQLRNDAGQEGLADIAYRPLNGDAANFAFYGINHMTDQFMRLDPERMTVFSTQSLGVDTDRFVGLDIASDGTPFAAIRVAGVTRFGSIGSSTTSAFQDLGPIGDGVQYRVRGVAAEPRRQAPVINDALSPVLDAIDEDDASNTGTRIRDLLDSVLPAALITDGNPGALRGIAITGLDASIGVWQFSLDGVNWSAAGSPDDSSALLLPDSATARIRLVPAAGFAGAVSQALRFRAWDQTSGLQGQRLAVGAGGGASSFSTGAVWASILVRDISHPPTITVPQPTGGSIAITDKATAAPFGSTTIAYPDSAGQTLTVVVSLLDPAHGAITDESVAAAGFSILDAASKQYRFIGNAAAATAAIRSLVFRPAENTRPVGQQTVSLFRVNVDDGQGQSAQAFSPFIASLSVRDEPVLAAGGPAIALDDKQTAPIFAQALISTVDIGAGDLTVDVEIPAGKGAFTSDSLAASGFSLLGGSAGTYRFVGSAAAATAAIRQLVFKPTENLAAAGSITAISLQASVSDGLGPVVQGASPEIDIRSVNDAPKISGLTITNKFRKTATVKPLRSLSLSDIDPGETITLTINLTAPKKGAFTAQTLRASGFRKTGNGKYTFVGTAAAVNAAARKLRFAWAANLNTAVNQSLKVKLTVTDAGGAKLINQQTSLTLLR